MTESGWPTEWLRGALEMCALAVIARGETYGYAIASELAEAGLGVVKGGTLYPILGRLEDAGLVETQWRAGDSGPVRKYYRLTGAGHTELAARTATWHSFATNLTDLLKEPS